MLPTNKNDTGLTVTTTSVEAWRADGTELDQGSLGDPTVFTGNSHMLLGLQVEAPAARTPRAPHMVLRCWLCRTPPLDAALLYVTVSVAGTHAGLWVTRD